MSSPTTASSANTPIAWKFVRSIASTKARTCSSFIPTNASTAASVSLNVRRKRFFPIPTPRLPLPGWRSTMNLHPCGRTSREGPAEDADDWNGYPEIHAHFSSKPGRNDLGFLFGASGYIAASARAETILKQAMHNRKGTCMADAWLPALKTATPQGFERTSWPASASRSPNPRPNCATNCAPPMSRIPFVDRLLPGDRHPFQTVAAASITGALRADSGDRRRCQLVRVAEGWRNGVDS